MTNADATENFVRELTENQNRLYGYVFSLLGDHARAGDVVQETNLVLWRKIDEYQPDRPFLPWAFAIARFQVLASIRDQNRDHCLLNADLAEKISGIAIEQASDFHRFGEAVRACVQRLTPNNRDLVEKRYYQSMSLADISASVGRTVGSIKVAIMRSRRTLAACITKQIAVEGSQ